MAPSTWSAEQSAGFGMRPRSRWLVHFAVWGLTHRRVQAMSWYNRLFLPLGLLLQRPLAWAPGLIDVAKVDELLLVCRSVRDSRRGARRIGAACSVRPVPQGVTIGSRWRRPQLKPASDVGPRRMVPAQARTRSTAKVGSNSNQRAAKFSRPGAR